MRAVTHSVYTDEHFLLGPLPPSEMAEMVREILALKLKEVSVVDKRIRQRIRPKKWTKTWESDLDGNY